MVTVISPSVSGSCSYDPHQSLTLRPWRDLEVPRDKTHQVDGKCATFPLRHLKDVFMPGFIVYCALARNISLLCVSCSNSLIFLSLQHFLIFVFEYKVTFWDKTWWFCCLFDCIYFLCIIKRSECSDPLSSKCFMVLHRVVYSCFREKSSNPAYFLAFAHLANCHMMCQIVCFGKFSH